MGEQPLFSCKAHVFQLEPEHKKSWIALSSMAVNVNIFHDPIKNIYRIVSIEGTKALINSIVTAKMTFTKTSQKFGQWIDFKLNLVYGLGFPNDAELNKFVAKFKEIKEYTRSSSHKTHERSNSCEISANHNYHRHFHNQNLSNESGETSENTYKLENERLKLALSHSTKKAANAEEECQTLREAQSNLNKALQESHAHLEDWKKQSLTYKDECEFLRTNTTYQNNTNNQQNSNQRYIDDFNDDSSTSTNSFNTNLNNNHNYNSKTGQQKHKLKQEILKQELIKLTDHFDLKLKELYQVRESMQKIISELD